VKAGFPGSARLATSRLVLNLPGHGEVSIPVLVTALASGDATGLSADFNGDGLVDFSDFFLFADAYEQPVNERTAIYDLNGNGKINIEDFFRFADAFGERAD